MVLIVAPTLGVKASIGIVAIPTTKSKVSKQVVIVIALAKSDEFLAYTRISYSS